MANLYLIQFNFIYTYFSDVTASFIKKYKTKIQKYKIHLLKIQNQKTQKNAKLHLIRKKCVMAKGVKAFELATVTTVELLSN